jgi:phenylpropionate dioxygenase-like ring-hydroxylating dioxygenase large terminal subunit
MTFVRNAWYVAGWAHDLTTEPLAETILSENVVLWRGEDGKPRAAENVCPHRFLPLSQGRVRGNDLQCGYHGLTFDGAGTCIDAPTQDAPPANCQIRSYPVHENMGMIWIWMGDPALADTADIYDLPEYHQDGWGVGYGDALDVDAHYHRFRRDRDRHRQLSKRRRRAHSGLFLSLHDADHGGTHHRPLAACQELPAR